MARRLFIKSLHIKIIVLFMILAIVPALIMGWLSVYSSQQSLENEIKAHLDTAAQSKAGHIQALLDNARSELKLILSRTNLRNTLVEYIDDPSEDKISLMSSILDDAKESLSEFNMICIISPDGVCIVSTGTPMGAGGIVDDQLFIQGKESESVFLMKNKEGIPSIFLSGPIYVDDQFLGVMLIEKKIDPLFDLLEEMTGMRETGESYLVNKDLLMISPSRFVEDDFLKQKVDTENARNCFMHETLSLAELLEHHMHAMRSLDYRGVAVLGTHIYFPELEWCLLVEQDEEEAFVPIGDLRNGLLMIVIVVLIIAVLIALLFGKAIVKPLRMIEKTAEKVGAGDFHARADVKTGDELESLGDAINKMASDLTNFHAKDIHRRALLQSEVKKTTSELDKKMMEMQAARLATLNMMDDLDGAYQQLQDETKLKDELFNITSHELKSPLVPIIGYIELLKNGKVSGKLSKEQDDVLDIIDRNAHRLSNLIEDVLDIARLQAQKMKFNFRKDSLKFVFDEVDKMFTKAVEDKGLHLIFDIEQRLPKIEMDKSRMVQVISNLVGNALKFTDKGAISVHAKKEDDHIIIDVADTGIGISGDYLSNVFDKFYQVEASMTRKHGGSGLGLAIVKGIVEEHGGTIKAHSELGKGAVFTIRLPLVKDIPVKEKRKINIGERIKKFRKTKRKEERALKDVKLPPEEEIVSFFE